MEKIVNEDLGIIGKINERVVCFNVTKTYRNKERGSIYECARKYWHVSGLRVKKAEYVFAVSDGLIIGVYRPLRWYITDSKKYEGRWEFEGEALTDSPYLDKSVGNLFYHKRNSVAYVNM
ncbi:hypothetical protein [Prevotella sp.]|uniref:hypothetical protein n=1 Tax=Prevotella sp. TaxID=59823 RepID=UPI003AB45020